MLLRLSLLLIAIGVVVGVVSASLLGVSVYFTSVSADPGRQESITIRQLTPLDDQSTSEDPSTAEPTERLKNRSREAAQSTLTPAELATTPEFLTLSDVDQAEASQSTKASAAAAEVRPTATVTATTLIEPAIISQTDVLTRSGRTEPITKSDVISLPATPVPATSTPTVEAGPEAEPELATELEYNEPYTSTNQVQPPPSADPTAEPVAAASSCPASSSVAFDLIPIEGRPLNDHPAYVHGDLNLALRGYVPVGAPLELVDYEGATDGDPPQLHGLFEPNRAPNFSSVYRINDWTWDSSQCGGHPRGCPGPPADTFWPVTLAGIATTPGESIHIPERGTQIYSGGYIALVLYAEEKRITLGYTRRDTVAAGYVVHIDNVCVNPNLVALYKAQEDADGWLATGHLPALRNNQPLGTALSHEIQVAIRDAGTFMDPRSQKDWWR